MFLKDSDDGEDHPDEEQKSRLDCIHGQRRVQESIQSGKDAKKLIRDGLAQVPYRRVNWRMGQKLKTDFLPWMKLSAISDTSSSATVLLLVNLA